MLDGKNIGEIKNGISCTSLGEMHLTQGHQRKELHTSNFQRFLQLHELAQLT